MQRAEGVHWISSSRTHYEARLRDVDGFVTGLMEGFEAASKALSRYATAITTAQRYLEREAMPGTSGHGRIARVGKAITLGARSAEPMRQWEDLRGTTGLLDWLAELQVDVDSIRSEADSLHHQASQAFHQAQQAEQIARVAALSELRAARDFIPNFRSRFKDAASLLDRVDALRIESAQASQDPKDSPPWQWQKADFFLARAETYSFQRP